MKRLERTQITPPDPSKEAVWRDAPPAPRHIAALMQIVIDEGMSVSTLATRLGVSRPTAGRLLARAKSDGLVRIEVVVPPDVQDDLHAGEERELERRFGLTEAVIAGHDIGASTDPAAFASRHPGLRPSLAAMRAR